MKPDQNDAVDFSKPVAYSTDGQPLYAHPPTVSTSSNPPSTGEQPQQDKRSSHVKAAPETAEGHDFNPRIRTQYSNEPKVVHQTREHDIEPFEINDTVNKRHEESVSAYPELNLSAGEYMILDIKRHPIGLILPLAAGSMIIAIMLSLLVLYPTNPSTYGLPGFALAALILVLLIILIGIGVFVAVWVYLQNQFFLTNESVIQEIQMSLFSRREQMVSLGSIEDASFHKSGIPQSLFDYGTLRLSTEGDETTYRFAYVKDPRRQVSIVNNAIEAFKNGRPFELDQDMN